MTEATIFENALQKSDAAERAAYLEAACGDDARLRRHIEDLLRAHDQAGDYLERPAVEQIATEERPDFLEASQQPGSLGKFGRYEVLEILGRGSSATVLKARDPGLHRVVAVKVLAPVLAASDVARQRFLREARAAAAVRDEHVVAPHAVEDAPLPYLVMEYVAGQTLQQKLERSGPLPVREILRIGVQVARGLSAIHAQGLVHRDLKPANILLENGIERVKITDFGLARLVSDAALSQPGIVLGTPTYMSPEQAQGEPIDQRSDLFSLGSVLYALATGKPPFRGTDTQAVLRRVIEETPRPVHAISPEIPGWLSELIARLLAKRPDARPQSAREVADLLEQQLAALQMPGKAAPARPAPGRRRRYWMAAAALLLALAGLAAAESSGVTQVTGSVIRLFEPDGTLVIETDAPDVSVRVDDKEVVISGAGPREIRLRPGEHWIKPGKEGVRVDTPVITVQRNGRTIVRVHREPRAAVLPPLPAGKIVPAFPGAVTAEELIKTFRTNIALGTEKFAERHVAVTGRVLRIADGQKVWTGKEGFGWNYRLEMASEEEGIQASYLSFQFFVPEKTPSPLAQLKPGDVTTIEAECKGWLPEHNRPDTRPCIYFWDSKVLAPKTGSSETSGGSTEDGLRHLARWVLSVGGSAQLKVGGKEEWVGPRVRLPDAWFSIAAINLAGCKQVGDAEMGLFTVLADLRRLQLDYLPITDAGLVKVAQVRNLTELSLKHTSVGDGSLPLLAKLTNLKVLDLSETRLTEKGLQHLDELGRISTLALGDLPFTDAVMPRLAELTYLVHLNLRGTKITDTGVRELARLHQLISLDLSKTALTDAGLEPLGSLEKLYRLVLDGTRIKGPGLKALARCADLHDLSLADTPLTEDAVSALATLSHLKHLNLRGSGLSASAIARLRRALPECQVVAE